MGIYRGLAPLKAYKGDMQPVNVYRGSTKVAGWHSASYSGTSPLTVDCDYNVHPDALVIDGKCQQDTTTGKNLLSNSNPMDNSNNPSAKLFTYTLTGSIAAGVYTLSFPGRYAQGNINLYKATPLNFENIIVNVGWGAYTAKPFTITETTALAVLTIDVAPNSICYPQLELGSTATPYEPYTGGIPSPNPDYPQPITTITGDLTITAANGDLSDTVAQPLGSVELCSLPDGTKDSYDAVTGIVTKRCGKLIATGAVAIGLSSGHPYVVVRPSPDSTGSGSIGVSGAVYSDKYLYTRNTSFFPRAYRAWNAIIVFDDRFVDLATARAILAAEQPIFYYKLATPTTVQLTPHLPVVRTGIKTLSVGADVMPTISATVKAMD